MSPILWMTVTWFIGVCLHWCAESGGGDRPAAESVSVGGAVGTAYRLVRGGDLPGSVVGGPVVLREGSA